MHHWIPSLVLLHFATHLLLPDIPVLSPCLGKHRRGCGNTACVDDWFLLLSLKYSLDEAPFISITAPRPSGNFLSPNSPAPLSTPLKAGGAAVTRGTAAHLCPQRSDSAQWTQLNACELPGATSGHKLLQSCPGVVLISDVPKHSCPWAVPCLPSPQSSAPVGGAAPASPHSAANAATLMQSKE